MKLKIINSDSSGNCYILENDSEALIIECGVKFSQIKKAMDYDISKIVGCLVSHEHKDHSLSIVELLKAGIKVYSSKGTFDKSFPDHGKDSNAIVMQQGKRYEIGGFKVKPFPVLHDANEPFGFYLSHSETGNILFATDTASIDYLFSDLNNIIIEANYSSDDLLNRVYAGKYNMSHAQRLERSHMSIEYCTGYLQDSDLSGVNNIVLIHLSDGNSDAEKFRKKVRDVTGKNVYIADSNVIIDFNECDF